MSSTVLTSATLAKLLTPLITDLYNGAKGKIKENLNKWSTTAGIKKVSTKLLKIDQVKTIWSPEAEISLKKFYYPSKAYSKSEATVVDNIRDLPNGNLVIEGIVGQGKSIFMRYLATSILSYPTLETIPVFIELRTITVRRTLQDAICIFLSSIGIKNDTETFEYLATSEKLTLILDGFDEIPSECVSDTIMELEVLQTKYPDLKIIVSSRPRSNIQNAVGFSVVRLVPLEPSDYDPFVSKLIPSSVKRFEVIEALKDCPAGIKGIIRTPLMLTLVVLIYQTEKEIPSTLSDFFDKLFGIVFTKHDKLKAGFNRQHHSGLSERRLKQLFEAFCFMTIQRGSGRSLSEKQFNNAFSDAVEYLPECKCEVETFRKDIVKVACLMLEEGLDTTTFLHKSILDYHAAAFVRDLPDNRAVIFYSTSIEKYSQWQYPLQFLKTIDQLRYTEHYSLNFLPQCAKELEALIQQRNTGHLTSFLESIHPKATLKVSGKIVKEWGPLLGAHNEVHDEIGDLLLNEFMSAIDRASESDLLAAANLTGSSFPDNSGRIAIGTRGMIAVFGADNLWKMLNGVLYRTELIIEESEHYIATEKQKETIFGNILSATPLKISGKSSPKTRKQSRK